MKRTWIINRKRRLGRNKTTNNTIQLRILNKSFYYTFNIKKKQCIRFIFLLGERCTDKITTKYIKM